MGGIEALPLLTGKGGGGGYDTKIIPACTCRCPIVQKVCVRT